MERTLEKKAEDDSCLPSEAIDTDLTTEQCKLVPSDTNRLACTSAAVISFALSIGAHSVLMGSAASNAIAAEPASSDLTAAQSYQLATGSQTIESSLPGEQPSTPRSIVIEHIVQDGQTLSQIAQIYHLESAQIAQLNGISLDAVLKVGQSLKVPADSLTVSAAASDSSSVVYYGLMPTQNASAPVVSAPVAGTPLKSLSAKVASARPVAVAASTEHNGLTQPDAAQAAARQNAALDTLREKRNALQVELDRLKLEQRSEISNANASASIVRPADIDQTAGKQATATQQKRTYRVVEGDSLASIARDHGVSFGAIMAANQLDNPDLLEVDQLLVIPQSAAQASALPNDNALIIAARPTASLNVELPSMSKPLAAATPSAPGQNLAARSFVPSSTTSFAPKVDVAGASATTAKSNLSAVPQTLPTTRIRGSYVDNLRAEISQLRQKYGDAKPVETRTRDMTVAVNPVTPKTAVNAEIVGSSTKGSIASSALPAKVSGQGGAAVRSVESRAQQNKLVATASNGRQNYEALTQSAVGKMVSPELPALGSADAYLPGSVGRFKGYIWPAKGVLTSPFGWRWGRMHSGIDVAGPVGTPIVAAAPGVVKFADWNDGGYGYLVEIEHPDGSMTRYGHNDRILVREGQQVQQGQQIAEMGSTGYSTGPHSHFEIHLAGQGAVNPMAYLGREEG